MSHDDDRDRELGHMLAWQCPDATFSTADGALVTWESAAHPAEPTEEELDTWWDLYRASDEYAARHGLDDVMGLRAWARVQWATNGTPMLIRGGNVGRVERVATGKARLIWKRPLPHAEYSATATPVGDAAAVRPSCENYQMGSVEVELMDAAGAYVNADFALNVVC